MSLRSLSLVTIAVLAAVGAILLIPTLLGGDTEHVGPESRLEGPRPPFAPNSAWNEALDDDAPIDPKSSEMIGNLRATVARKPDNGNGWIETGDYSVPVYTVGKDQKTVPVQLTAKGAYADTLRRVLAEGVPIPDDAKPAAGTDHHLVVLQPSTDRMWEFWQARRRGSGWTAAWGGAMQSVSRNPGYFDPRAWPGAAQPNWGASATSLPLLGGLMRISELDAGRINHALAIALPAPRAKVFAAPAQRTDGFSNDASSIPEGAHLRLAPDADIGAIRSPLVRAMAEAAQKYGLIVRDKTATGVAFFAENPASLGRNPYKGSEGLLEGQYPNELLMQFPWDKLQVLKMDLHGAS